LSISGAEAAAAAAAAACTCQHAIQDTFSHLTAGQKLPFEFCCLPVCHCRQCCVTCLLHATAVKVQLLHHASAICLLLVNVLLGHLDTCSSCITSSLVDKL
jgi:hypothetical protein